MTHLLPRLALGLVLGAGPATSTTQSQAGPPAAPRDLETWSYYDSLSQETETGLHLLMTGRSGPVNFSILIRHKGRSTSSPPIKVTFQFVAPPLVALTEYTPTLKMAIDAGRPTQLMLDLQSSTSPTAGVQGRVGGPKTIGSTPTVDTLRALAEAQTARITVFEGGFDLRFDQIRAIRAFADRVSARASGSVTTLTIDKKRFATAEPLVFWAGVSPASAGAIPAERQQAGTLTITRPDKRTRTVDVPWPTDGLTSRGWIQAVVVDGEAPQQGEYRAVFSHANRESPPVFFFFEDAPILRQIAASFTFPAGFRLAPGNSVTLVVENKSRETIRIAKRGGRRGAVAVDLTGRGGTVSRSLYYPEAALLEAGGLSGESYPLDALTWTTASNFPIDTVRAGGTLRVTLPIGPLLSAIQSALPTGEYEITVATLLDVLIAERGGPWSGLSPIRIEATGTVKAVR